MKKRKFNAFLSLLLVFSLVVGQPVMALAEEITPVTENEEKVVGEEGSENTDSSEAVSEDEEDSQASGEGEDIDTSKDDENSDANDNEASEDNNETNTDADNSDEGNTDADGNGEGNTDADDSENDADAVDNDGSDNADAENESDVLDNSQNAALSIEKQKTIDELGFKTMDINKSMLQEKGTLAMVVDSISKMKSGEDYVEHEIVYLADSEKDAKAVAECYGGTLESFEYDVAVASIEQNVLDAVKIAADMDIPIPAVYPNVIYSIESDFNSSSVDASGVTIEEVSEDTNSVEGKYIDAEDVEEDGFRTEENEPLYRIEGEESVYALNPTDPGYGSQWHHGAVNTVDAWDAAKGAGVEIAVLDSGVDYNHPDLPKMDPEKDCVQTVGYGNGKDDNGHGTHCIGIIAAQANNIGGVGIAPEASIYSVKILDAAGRGDTVSAIKGMRAAVSRNVDIISMSFGSFCYDQLFQKEIDSAVGKGILLVAAAGNEATSQKTYPAAYNNVVAVASTEGYDEDVDAYTVSYFSNYGSWVDIAAPGEDIYSTLPTYSNSDPDAVKELNYGTLSGTSMACPVVAASAALMLSNNSSLKDMNTKAGASKIIKTLIDSAEQGGAYDYGTRYPFVDAEAVTYAVDSSVPQPPTVRFSSGEPDSKGVVRAGVDEELTFGTTTPHAKIYFTINGKKPTAKTGYRYYMGTKLIMNVSGKVKIQAITVVGNKTSKVFSKTYKFDVKATGLTSPYDDIKNDITVAIGKSIQLNVDVIPSIASSKKLEWSSDDATGMIKVNKSSGKVTCNKNATAGAKAVIKAKTTDGSNIEYSFTVTAINEKVEFLTLNKTSVKMSWWADDMDMKEPNGTAYVSDFWLMPEEATQGVTTKQYLYKSSNTKVAVVDSDGWVSARGKGKAKITVTANDGSGKTAVCNVEVVTPVVRISATSSTGYSGTGTIPIGTGCSISMKSVVNWNSKYYLDVPNNNKVEWTSENAGVISVKSNGKVTCSSNATIGTIVNVTVAAKDGWGTSLTIPFQVVDKIEKIYYVKDGNKYPTMMLIGDVGDAGIDPLRSGRIGVDTMHNTGLIDTLFSVSVSNRDVIYRYYDIDVGDRVLLFTKPGTSKITYTARDGSNKKITLTCKVSPRDLKLN